MRLSLLAICHAFSFSLVCSRAKLVHWYRRLKCSANDDVFVSCVCVLVFRWRHAVPSAPRALQLTRTQDEPPVIAVTWQPPRTAHGRLEGYKLTYGIREDSYVEERRFDADKRRFTTGFLGQSLAPLGTHTKLDKANALHPVGVRRRRRCIYPLRKKWQNCRKTGAIIPKRVTPAERPYFQLSAICDC